MDAKTGAVMDMKKEGELYSAISPGQQGKRERQFLGHIRTKNAKWILLPIILIC
jgi:isocitrate dehydrogenase kinase/phosphatase